MFILENALVQLMKYQWRFHQGDIGLYSPKAVHCMKTPDDGDVVINVLIRKNLFDQTF